MSQLDLWGQDKEQTAIRFLREHEPSEEPYFLGFSGGKDSVVLYEVAKRSGVNFVPYYSSTGIDPPELTRFIRKHYPEVIWKRPKMSFFKWIVKKGPPTIRKRWCCDKLKKDPTNDVPLKYRVMGTRAEESHNRKMRGWITEFTRYNQIHYHPLFNWLEWEVWEYIEDNELPYCKLYDLGFTRLGCVVCPYVVGKQIMEVYRERWPQLFRAFERAVHQWWDEKEAGKFKPGSVVHSAEEYLKMWYGYTGGEKWSRKKYMKLHGQLFDFEEDKDG